MIGIGTYGMEDNVALGESADWHSIHTHVVKQKMNSVPASPACFRKHGCPHLLTRAGEKDLEDHLSKSLA